jgi:dTDP-4-amino-4,6-dideoxygalactose transaminase
MGSDPFLPYGRHAIDDDDVAAVVAALRSDHLAHGPRVAAFERAFAEACGAAEAVACSNGTTALHLALLAAGVGEGDRCIVPAVTFLSTATAVRMCGAEVIFADVDPVTGALTPQTLRAALADAGGPVRAVLPVHLGGRFCDLGGLQAVAASASAVLVEDACHALGGRDAEGDSAGACAHSAAATFSLHPVKTIAAGEGGMVTLNDAPQAERLRRLRNHGVSRDPGLMADRTLSFDQEGAPNPWSYEQIEFGFNYRMDEMSAALGQSQLAKLPSFVMRRAALAERYDGLLAGLPAVRVVPRGPGSPSLHLYQVLIEFEAVGVPRPDLMRRMAAQGIGTQVHYIPLNRQPFFRERYGPQQLPGTDSFYAQVLALPLFPAMSEDDVDRSVKALKGALQV